MATKTVEKLKKQAYMLCNNVKVKDLALPEHKAVLDNALSEVQMFLGYFESEDAALRNERLMLDGASYDDPTELANYFRRLYADNAEELPPTSWGIVFTMYNRMKGLESLEPPVTAVTGSTAEEVTPEAESSSEIDSTKIKEDTEKMETTTTSGNSGFDDAIAKLTQEPAIGEDMKGAGSLPTSKPSSDATMKAADEHMTSTIPARKNESANAKIHGIVVAKPSREVILVDGKDAKGVPLQANIQKQIDSIIKKADIVVDPETGKRVAYAAASPDDAEKAIAMLEKLERVLHGETIEWAIYMGTPSTPIKAVWLRESSDVAPKYVTLNAFKAYVVDKTAGAVGGTTPEVQVRLARAAVKKSAKTGTSTRTEKPKSDVYSGVLSLKWAGKDVLMEHPAYWQEPDKAAEIADTVGYRSEESFVYKVKKSETDKEYVNKTYRLPLVAKSYKLVVPNNDIKAVLGLPKAGVGGPVQPLNLSDENEVRAMLDLIKETQAKLTDDGVNTATTQALRARAEAIQNATSEQQAEEVSGDL